MLIPRPTLNTDHPRKIEYLDTPITHIKGLVGRLRLTVSNETRIGYILRTPKYRTLDNLPDGCTLTIRWTPTMWPTSLAPWSPSFDTRAIREWVALRKFWVEARGLRRT